MVEDILGCKWSLAVLARVRQGVHRPGALEQSIEGISTKVLNERLRKLTRFGILQRTSYPELRKRPPQAVLTSPARTQATRFQGSRSSSLLIGCSAIRRRTSRRYASGSRPLSLAVPMTL